MSLAMMEEECKQFIYGEPYFYFCNADSPMDKNEVQYLLVCNKDDVDEKGIIRNKDIDKLKLISGDHIMMVLFGGKIIGDYITNINFSQKHSCSISLEHYGDYSETELEDLKGIGIIED